MRLRGRIHSEVENRPLRPGLPVGSVPGAVGGFRTKALAAALRAAVRGKVLQDLEGDLRVPLHLAGKRLRREGLAGRGLERRDEALLELDDAGRRLLAGLDPRLVIGVHVHERSVEADHALVEGDQHPHRARGDLRKRQGDGPTVLLTQGVAGPQIETLEVVAARDAGLHVEGLPVAVLHDIDEGDEEVLHALPQLLDVGVLVGRALVPVDRNALVPALPCHPGPAPCPGIP